MTNEQTDNRGDSGPPHRPGDARAARVQRSGGRGKRERRRLQLWLRERGSFFLLRKGCSHPAQPQVLAERGPHRPAKPSLARARGGGGGAGERWWQQRRRQGRWGRGGGGSSSQGRRGASLRHAPHDDCPSPPPTSVREAATGAPPLLHPGALPRHQDADAAAAQDQGHGRVAEERAPRSPRPHLWVVVVGGGVGVFLRSSLSLCVSLCLPLSSDLSLSLSLSLSPSLSLARLSCVPPEHQLWRRRRHHLLCSRQEA